ncbi:1-deoxy-D-xylulose-5-phosphate reductoisomerase [Rickettsiales bacterium LUAb2]
MLNKLGIIGSTGSVGKSAIEVIAAFKDKFKVKFLAANSNYKLLAEQAKLVNPESIVILNDKYLNDLRNECKALNVSSKIYCGKEDLLNLVKIPSQNILVANNGIEALPYILAAIEVDNIISLANKEALVSAGNIINMALKTSKSYIIPVDSEHNAIYQIINYHSSNNKSEIDKLIITASGGPFYNKNNNELKSVTLTEVLKHPNWSMGAEICVNSATLVNKGLEIIEAYYLFNVPKENINALYHPQSLVHGVVAYKDSSFILSASPTSMKVPIAFALSNGEKLSLPDITIPITKLNGLIFEEIKPEKLMAINLAKAVLKEEGNRPCIFNVANEIAIRGFISGKINFTNIINVIDFTLNKIEFYNILNIDNIYETIKLSNDIASQYINTLM